MIFRKLRYEIKAMGIVFYIPFVLFIIVNFYSLLLKSHNGNIYHALKVLELSLPVATCWWTNYYLANLFEHEGGEVFLTYKIPIVKITLYTALRYFFLHLILTIASTLLIFSIFEYFSIGSIILYMSQCIFYFGLSYIAITMMKETSWNLFLCFAYLSIQFLTSGKIFVLINIHNFDNRPELNIYLSLKSILFGLSMIIITQIFINKTKGNKRITDILKNIIENS